MVITPNTAHIDTETLQRAEVAGEEVDDGLRPTVAKTHLREVREMNGVQGFLIWYSHALWENRLSRHPESLQTREMDWEKSSSVVTVC